MTKVARVHFHLLKRSFLRNSMWWILATISVIIFIGLYVASFSLINNVIVSICAQIYDKYVLSVVIYAVTLFLCISLIRDYLSGDFKWAKHRRAVFIIIPVTGFTVAYAFFERTDALLGNIILTSTYLLYACFIKNAGESGIPPKPHDQLYRSRLFNRTHQHIRKLAKSTPHGLTIGICGQWGSGKTFFIDTLLALLSRPVNVDLRNSEQWNEKFIICKKVELWSTSSLDDAWNRIIHALHIGIFNRPPICNAKAKKLLSFLTALSSNQTAAHELIELILPEFEDIHLQSIVNKMKEHKVVLVIDDLERADFSIIQAMLPLFERLKKLPNLIVICAVAEEELKRVFLRERVLPDFVQGHLAKLFDLRIEIPTMAYTAIEHFQNNLFNSKYKDCPLVRSFLAKYQLCFDSARQMVRVIDKLVSIEHQYFVNCSHYFEREEEKETHPILIKAKYIFLIEALRVSSPYVLNILKEQVHINLFLAHIPSEIVPTSKYIITQGASAMRIFRQVTGNDDTIKAKLYSENEWINKHRKLHKILSSRGIELSILTHMRRDVTSLFSATPDFRNEVEYHDAILGSYTRCTTLNEWELEELLTNHDYLGLSYSQMINQYFSILEEVQEHASKSEAAFQLLEYHIKKAASCKSKQADIESTLTAECNEYSQSYLRNCSHLSSGAYIEYIEKLSLQQNEDNIITIDINNNIFEKLFNLLHIGEQSIVINSYFNLMRDCFKVEQSSNFSSFIAPNNKYLSLMHILCKNYGYNLAEQIESYPSHSCNSLYSFASQAYREAPDNLFTNKFKEGISTYICNIPDKSNFIVKWLEFMGHQYHSGSIRGGCDSSFANNKVLEMMAYIKEQLNISPETISRLPNKAVIRLACASSLEKLRADYKKWSTDQDIDRKTKYSSGIFFIIQMIEEIQKAAI